jgi:hypothetical protein
MKKYEGGRMRIRVEIALKMMPPRYGGEAFVVVGSGGDHE